MSTTIRVLLVDDQELFREGLRTLLSVRPDIEVVGEAGNGEEALRLALNLQPDVVLMDLRMPVLDGVKATQRLHNTLPHCHVIILTTFDDDEYIFEGLRAGALGYLLKDISSSKLVEAIQAAHKGEFFLPPAITARVVNEFARLSQQAPARHGDLAEQLSDRELEILRLVATGASNKEIATDLVIAEGTVKNHLSNIFGKLSVGDRAQAVLKAKDLGIL